MDTVKILQPPTGGTIQAIPSKSAAHRLLIAGFLSGLDITDSCKDLSDDITATSRCLAELAKAKESDGAKELGGKECASAGQRGAGSCRLNCGESGSTLRFLMPLAAALGIESDFVCEGRLADRPMEPFLEVLAAHGCSVEGHNPKHLTGQLTAGTFTLPGSISSQFITGLLIALPILRGDSKVIVTGSIQSRPYIDLTLQILRTAGIKITEETKGTFLIDGGQNYALPADALNNIEGDWSAAAFWIVIGAMIEGHIAVNGLDPKSVQGDKAIIPLIRKCLCPERAVSAIESLEIDVADTPDLVPALAVLACARPAGSVTRITGAGRLRYKESDRLRAVSEVLSSLGAAVEEGEDQLTITAKGKLTGGEADSFGDHRIAMMAAAAACIAAGPVTITNAGAVSKSYPKFYEDYQRLGGKLQWL